MAGIVVQLLLSWIIIRLVEKKDLSVLGFRPSTKRLSHFFLFLLLTAFFSASGFFMRMYFGERWMLNPAFSFSLLMEGLWWNIKSVLFEELIFRGVLLYILIKRLGAWKGILISSIGFGIYHWFSFEIIGQVKNMIIVFIATGTMGLLYAYSYYKSFSLYIPIAIHLGWNFTRNFVFSDGNIGPGILMMDKPAHSSTVSYFTYYFIVFFPMIAAMIVNYLLIRTKYKTGGNVK